MEQTQTSWTNNAKFMNKYKIHEKNTKINLSSAKEIIYNAINDSIFPGAQVFISKGDNIIFIF